MLRTLTIHTRGQGLHEITPEVRRVMREFAAGAGPDPGDAICTIFIRHTSASLLIQENAAPSVRRDLQNWLARLVPERDALYTHTDEGPDDMPAHVKAALTNASLSIPVSNGELLLGRWQGIYVWEHRHAPHAREVVVRIG